MCHEYRTVVLFFALVLVACGASNEAQLPAAAASGICDPQYVASTDAGNHVDKEVTVCGKIIDYFYIDRGEDKPTLLFFDTGVVRRANFGITEFRHLKSLPTGHGQVLSMEVAGSYRPHPKIRFKFGLLYDVLWTDLLGSTERYDNVGGYASIELGF